MMDHWSLRVATNPDSVEIKIDDATDFIPSLEALGKISKSIDQKMGTELYNIRKEEREAIQNEIHGVQSRSVSETPGMIRSGLEALEQEINETLCRSSSTSDMDVRELVKSHQRAVDNLHSQYVVAPGFRLRFLRAEFFDAKKAALRYFKCLNYMFASFGDISLQRPLRITDLSEIERAYLETGKIQVLLRRDRMGRKINLCFVGDAQIGIYPLNVRHKVEVYMNFQVLAEDEETQIHGAVGVVLLCLEGDHSKIDSGQSMDDGEKMVYRRMWSNRGNIGGRDYLAKRREAAPFRHSAFHICMPNARIYHFLKTIVLGVLPSVLRPLIRIHNGSHLELCYKLCQFGMLAMELPSSSAKATAIYNKSLAKFLRARTAIDSFRSNHPAKYEYYRCSSQQSRVKHENETETAGELPQPKALPTEDFCLGTDCPESNCVVFGDRNTYKSTANEDFREFLRTKEESLCSLGAAPQATTAFAPAAATTTTGKIKLKVEVLDQIIDELCMAPLDTADSAAGTDDSSSIPSSTYGQHKVFKFAVYDKQVGWYRYIDHINSKTDRIELRKRISQTIRDDRKRTAKVNNTIYRQETSRGRRRDGGLFSLDEGMLPPINFDQEIWGDINMPTSSNCGALSFCTRQFDAKRPKTNHCSW